MPERWKLRLIRHFGGQLFRGAFKRLGKNTDIDTVSFDTDKKDFMK